MALQKSVYKKSRLSERIRMFSISFRLRPAHGGLRGEAPETACEVELVGRHYLVGRGTPTVAVPAVSKSSLCCLNSTTVPFLNSNPRSTSVLSARR